MYIKENFKIISVTGAHSGVGKTTLCAILLNRLAGFGAIKFTKTDMFTSISEDPETILKHGKDTAIMSEAGAEKVIWIQSPYGGLEECINLALAKMHGLRGIVVEGNSPSDLIRPHLIIFVIGPGGQIKESAGRIGKKADIIIINSEKKPYDLKSTVSAMNLNNAAEREFFWIDLAGHRGEIDKFLACVEKMLIKKLN